MWLKKVVNEVQISTTHIDFNPLKHSIFKSDQIIKKNATPLEFGQQFIHPCLK